MDGVITVKPITMDGGIGALVRTGTYETTEVWMRSEAIEGMATDDLTPWAMALLPFAMRTGRALQLEGAVDEVLLHNLQAIQKMMHGWFPRRLTIVPVTPQRTLTSEPQPGRGAFFSGGADSFFTLAQADPKLDSIVLVGGFDIPVHLTAIIEQAAVTQRAAATEFGASAIQVMTNIRSLTGTVTDWGTEQHGACLASVAYALKAHLGQVCIASSFTDDDLHPWGSHPDLDPLWSSSGQTITHDTTTELRIEKLDAIMSIPSAREGLRVCWELTGDLNCGSCEKCIRTQVNLYLTGHDGECATLPPLRIEDVRTVRLVEQGARRFAEENLRYLRRSGLHEPELERALVTALRRGQATRILRRVPGSRWTYHTAKRLLDR